MDLEELRNLPSYDGQNPVGRLYRNKKIKTFFNSGINIKLSNRQGIIIVENEYYYALLSGKWQKIGRGGRWESSLPPKKFIDYVLRAEML